MNVENILKLAAFIEALPKGKFSMQDTLRESESRAFASCGSPACIAGWAAWEQQGRPEVIYDNRMAWDTGENSIIKSALEFFDISNDRSDSLWWTTIDKLFCGGYSPRMLAFITNSEAAQALRHFAVSGGKTLAWNFGEEDEECSEQLL